MSTPKDKFGPYIQRLMTPILDKEQDEFVTDLAFNELNRLKVNLEEFIVKNIKDDEEQSEQTVKQLLQEEKDNG